MVMAAGVRLAHYDILSPLGVGGMGEVWLAQDTRLERKVALKLLPAELTQNAERVRRFVQEAKAASALNHPNIITIHEIGEASTPASTPTGGVHYIATEFIDGETLRQRLTGSGLPLNAALDLVTQIAAALQAAHAAGIIHRDIKPENVMVRRDGIVKVLDFGLAKLTEEQCPRVDYEAATLAKVTTDPGAVLGTPQYMSPEQARGQKVDARTDVFSLGVMLYEMIAGKPPFEGVNAIEVMGAILNQEPAPLKQHAPQTPAELQRIVSKALRKEREERYQLIKELLLDLKSLKQELMIADFGLRNAESTSSSGQSPIPNPQSAIKTTSSASVIFSELKRHKRGVTAVLATLALLLGGIVYGLYRVIDHYSSTSTPSALKITRLTSTGKATRAAISPDGKFVVYAQDEGGQQSLWVTQVAAASNNQIVPAAEVRYTGITFARDGNFIYYVRNDKDNPRGALWQLPVLGGNARRLLANIASPLALSADGKQLAFVRNDLGQKESVLMVANADGTKEKKLAKRKYPDNFSHGGPAWSPDGKIIACGQAILTGGEYRSVVGVRVIDGTEQPITSQRWDSTTDTRIAWLSDNSGVLVTVSEQRGNQPQIWHLVWPGEEARSLTNELNGYEDITLTADSGTLAAIRFERVVNLWLSSNGDASHARQITSGSAREDGVRGLSWTPDGKIVYRSDGGGNRNIWIIAADGAGSKQLSANASYHVDPSVSPDGRYIVWASKQTRNSNIWRMEVDGSNPKQLTNGFGELFPRVSPDGKWVVYGVVNSSLQKIPIDGGDSVQLTDKTASMPVFSPDGKLIACNFLDEVSEQFKIAVIPFVGGPPIRVFDISGPRTRPIQWTPDGRAIAFIRTTNGVSNLWTQPLAGGEPKQLTDFKDQRIFNFALSRGVVNSDVVLLSGFR